VVETFYSLPSLAELDRIEQGLDGLRPQALYACNNENQRLQRFVYNAAYSMYMNQLIFLKILLCTMPPDNTEVLRKRVVDLLQIHQPDVADVKMLTEEQKLFLVYAMLKDEQGINIDDDVPWTSDLASLIQAFVVYAKARLTPDEYVQVRQHIIDEVRSSAYQQQLIDAMDAVAPVDRSIAAAALVLPCQPSESSVGTTAPVSAPVSAPAPVSVSEPAPAPSAAVPVPSEDIDIIMEEDAAAASAAAAPSVPWNPPANSMAAAAGEKKQMAFEPVYWMNVAHPGFTVAAVVIGLVLLTLLIVALIQSVA
jgi:hypothetical protein